MWICYSDRRYILIDRQPIVQATVYTAGLEDPICDWSMEAKMYKLVPQVLSFTAIAFWLLAGPMSALSAESSTQTVKAEVKTDWSSTTKERTELTIFDKGREVAIYHSGPALDKPYFHPLRTPDGRVVTYDSPADHLHHRGLSIGWPDVSGVDFWAEVNAAQGHRGYMETRGQKAEVNEKGVMNIEEVNGWFTEAGEVLLNESRKWRFYPPQGNMQLIDVDILFSPVVEKVVFGSNPGKPIEYHGLTLRIGPFEDIRFYNSEGAEGDTDCHGQPARWMAASGVQSGKPVTVAFLDNVDNDTHPSRFFVLGKGMQFISTSPNFEIPKTVYKGRAWRLAYRIVAAGAPPEGETWDLERLWRDYNNLP